MVSLDGSATACASWNASCKTRSCRSDRHCAGTKGADRAHPHRNDRPWPWPTWPSRRLCQCSTVQRHVQAVFASSPTSFALVRRDGVTSPKRQPRSSYVSRFANPYVRNLFGHLAATAVPGVEEVRGQTYRRTLRLATVPASSNHADARLHNCRAVLSDMRDLTATIARSRWLLDLDADPVAIDRQLSIDQSLAPLIAKSPGRRVLDALTEPRWRYGPSWATGFDHRGPDSRRSPSSASGEP